jgi:site-specific DNA-methyltransferase (adenine-specific)
MNKEKFLNINEIKNGDCLNLFKEIPDNSIDVTFADPPFNLKKKYNGYKDSLEFRDYLDWCEKWINEMVRVTKPEGSIFVHNIPKWLTYYAEILNSKAEFRHWISWDAPSAPMGKSLQPSHYGILFYVKDPKKNKFYEIRQPHKRDRRTGYLLKDYGGKKEQLHPFGPLVPDVWTDIHRIRHNKYRDEHPCQLPIHLLERILLMTTDEGDIVLDPFMGTGTTAIASKRLGRKFVGFELDDFYVQITNDKLDKTHPNSRIGKSWVSIFLKEIITLRDIDWEEVQNHFIIPDSMKEIDHTKIKPKNNKIFKNILEPDLFEI